MMNSIHALFVYLLLNLLVSTMKTHPQSLSSFYGSEVENPLRQVDAMMESENQDQTTLSDIEIDESVTEKMTYALLNDLVDQKERFGKQHLNNIYLQNLSPNYPQHAQSSEIPQTHTLAQKNRVLVDQLGNSFKIGQFRSILAELDEKSVQNVKESVEPEVRIEENKVKCVEKVMQVEEIVHDNIIKCTHSFTEKCHNIFITDYAPSQEEKCSTSFEKNCHITYQPMAFDEKVEICDEPLKKVCNDSITGEEVCRTEYETSCETRYKIHTVEQDEPVCKMVMEKKCDGVVVDNQDQANNGRGRRSIARIENGEEFIRQAENCEEWPVQKCTLEKKTVTKSNPETSCQKHPKKVCTTSNCKFVQSEKTCREETRSLVQNIPSEDCDLEPRETCKLETVLVPRLVEKPNCVQVPKEICVEGKTNPRKVSKPVVKEWCYRPQDFQAKSTKEALDLVLNQLK
ncbi:uncharacterized protein LOC111704869 isoform X2 [Eurytemora carolleeae]|uniref:uncharacterized protein LOC111704869 isoform X2 n=1 Tax=Eurytemora carolleeae TaxID=1294199 RepID=UPI000C764F6E|nr:uncharacterized protein LOC111704869 isoform X2 [Eurytemora carolleeae]|eukprot:XP_023333008.1 uncharacterized protein LOC111704869 isoform X2 [Eurytemora affinis]